MEKAFGLLLPTSHRQSGSLKGFTIVAGGNALGMLFSVSPSQVEAVRRYVLNQEEHHKKETFQAELRRILKKYGVASDERYLWD